MRGRALNLRTSPGSRGSIRPMNPNPGGWQALAECVRRRLDPELFYPGISEPVSPVAMSACAVCPVRAACLRFAMSEEAATVTPAGRVHRDGIWGGLTERQRSNLAAARRVRVLVPTSHRNSKRRGQRLGRTA
jgi:hypothetical protein